MTDWSKPIKVDQITMAFPANVIGKLMPEEDMIPEFRKNWTTNKWCKQAETWFFRGVDTAKSTVVFKDHIDTDEMRNDCFRQLQACLGSFEPSHEHKMAGVGYLMSQFFEELELVGKK